MPQGAPEIAEGRYHGSSISAVHARGSVVQGCEVEEVTCLPCPTLCERLKPCGSAGGTTDTPCPSRATWAL